jgi:hypothetical protein
MDFGIISLFDFHPGMQEEHPYYAETLQAARDAEALGYDSIWIGQDVSGLGMFEFGTQRPGHKSRKLVFLDSGQSYRSWRRRRPSVNELSLRASVR